MVVEPLLDALLLLEVELDVLLDEVLLLLDVLLLLEEVLLDELVLDVLLDEVVLDVLLLDALLLDEVEPMPPAPPLCWMEMSSSPLS